MIAAGVIGGVFLICTVVMFLGVKERDGESVCFACVFYYNIFLMYPLFVPNFGISKW